MNRRTVILTLALVPVLVLGAYASWLRQADLRRFEPAEIARLETAMWRDYYEKRYGTLFYHLYALSRTQSASRRSTASGSPGQPQRPRKRFNRRAPARRPTPRCRRS